MGSNDQDEQGFELNQIQTNKIQHIQIQNSGSTMSSSQGNQQIFGNSKIVPLTYVLKYDPPLIGMVYKTHENDKKKRIYKIYLHGLIYKNNADQITQQLFLEHALHLTGSNIARDQIKSLVNKLLLAWRKKSPQGQKYEEHSHVKSTKESTQELLSFNPSRNQGGNSGHINIQDFENYENYDSRGNKNSKKGQEEEVDDKLNQSFDEIDPKELEDLDPPPKQSKPQAGKGKQDKKASGGNLRTLKDLQRKHQQEENEFDFIIEDPKNMESLSDGY